MAAKLSNTLPLDSDVQPTDPIIHVLANATCFRIHETLLTKHCCLSTAKEVLDFGTGIRSYHFEGIDSEVFEAFVRWLYRCEGAVLAPLEAKERVKMLARMYELGGKIGNVVFGDWAMDGVVDVFESGVIWRWGDVQEVVNAVLPVFGKGSKAREVVVDWLAYGLKKVGYDPEGWDSDEQEFWVKDEEFRGLVLREMFRAGRIGLRLAARRGKPIWGRGRCAFHKHAEVGLRCYQDGGEEEDGKAQKGAGGSGGGDGVSQEQGGGESPS